MKEGIKKKLYGSEREHERVKKEQIKKDKGKGNEKGAVRKRARMNMKGRKRNNERGDKKKLYGSEIKHERVK